MKCSGDLSCIGAIGKTVAHSHISLTSKHGRAQTPCRLRGISNVSINHKIAVGIDITKHLSNDVSPPLPRLTTHNSIGTLSKLGRTIRRIVIVNVHCSLK